MTVLVTVADNALDNCARHEEPANFAMSDFGVKF